MPHMSRASPGYTDLVVGDSVDEKINIALMKKENLAETVVDNWKQYF